MTDPAEMLGLWRSYGRDDTDPANPLVDTGEIWIGAGGSLEMRMGFSGVDLEGSGERFTVRLHGEGRWESADGNFITRFEQCRMTSSLGDFEDDCGDPQPDSTALSRFLIADIGGRRAMITLSDDSETGEPDDTLYYAGASASFQVAPVPGSIAVLPRAQSPVNRTRRLALRDGGLAAVLPDGRTLDLRGRAWPARPNVDAAKP